MATASNLSENAPHNMCFKRKRKTNFSSQEITPLCNLVEEKYHTIHSGFNNKLDHKKKIEIWKEISSKVSALGVEVRSVEEVREKWRQLNTNAKQEKSGYKKGIKKTGGGPPPQEISEISQAILKIQDGNPSFTGIEGTINLDSFQLEDGVNDEKATSYNKLCMTHLPFKVLEADKERIALESAKIKLEMEKLQLEIVILKRQNNFVDINELSLEQLNDLIGKEQ
ncbi:uncharacterized protein LOC141912154 [Tubulanus polymorphus]|uniref:uncharacterized protein LOC141912154 n=1 Tax=Tubulanus polymorphus TaxID=672921 RepID=UPI003DA49811